MDEAVAALIIRMHMALVDEGIGPLHPEGSDRLIIDEAVAVAGNLFRNHELWDMHLISDEVHAQQDCVGWMNVPGGRCQSMRP